MIYVYVYIYIYVYIYAIHTQTWTGFDALDCSPRMVAVIVNTQRT